MNCVESKRDGYDCPPPPSSLRVPFFFKVLRVKHTKIYKLVTVSHGSGNFFTVYQFLYKNIISQIQALAKNRCENVFTRLCCFSRKKRSKWSIGLVIQPNLVLLFGNIISTMATLLIYKYSNIKHFVVTLL